jgi:hypothetical protein
MPGNKVVIAAWATWLNPDGGSMGRYSVNGHFVVQKEGLSGSSDHVSMAE